MNDSEAFYIKDNKLFIKIPVKNKGKFRWKNRKNVNEYGEGFSTDKVKYSENSYIEWQIGYDVPVRDYQKDPDAKPTTLTNYTFNSLKDVEKYPYELSEFLFAMAKANLVTEEEIKKLLCDINKSETSLEDEFKIKTDKVGDYIIDGEISFQQQNITLPTFIYHEKNDYSYVEISIQKQQYATGVQPMLYFSIPIISLSDSESMIGKTARELNFNYTTFVVDDKNKNCILNVFRFFGICSVRHKHDVSEILKLLINDYVNDK